MLLAPLCKHDRYWLDTWGSDCPPKISLSGCHDDVYQACKGVKTQNCAGGTFQFGNQSQKRGSAHSRQLAGRLPSRVCGSACGNRPLHFQELTFVFLLKGEKKISKQADRWRGTMLMSTKLLEGNNWLWCVLDLSLILQDYYFILCMHCFI